MSLPRARLAAVLIAALGTVLPATQTQAQSKVLKRLDNPSAIFFPAVEDVESDELSEIEGESQEGVTQTAGVVETEGVPAGPVSSGHIPLGHGHPGHRHHGAAQCDSCLLNSPHDAETVINCPHKCCDWSDHWYVSISGGWAHRNRVHEIVDNRTFLEFEEGFAANAAIGYRFDLLRFEAEYTFMNQEVEKAGAGAGPFAFASNASGNVSMRALMFNGYVDFQLFDWPWLPYFGAGIGVYQSELNGLYPAFFGQLGAPFATTPVNATSDIPLAWQLRAGVTRRLGTRTELFLGYRYFRGDTLTFASAPFATPATPTFAPNGAIVHAAEIGLRIKF